MKMKKILSLVLAVACVFSIAACGMSGDDETSTLVMATSAEFPPYEYYKGNNIVGIDVDIAKAIAEELGMELEIEDMAFNTVIKNVSSGKADIGLAGMTVTEERLEKVNFSDTYATATQVLIVAEGSDIKTVEDLDGKIIGVQRGTTGQIYARDIEGAKVKKYKKGLEAVEALSQGKIDAVMIDNEPANEFVSQVEGLAILEESFAIEEYAIAIAKENEELLTKVNEVLNSLSESGKLDEIVDKYIKAE